MAQPEYYLTVKEQACYISGIIDAGTSSEISKEICRDYLKHITERLEILEAKVDTSKIPELYGEAPS